MSDTRVELKVEGLEEVLRGLDPKLATDAVRSTTNKLAGLANTQIKRGITESYNIKQKDLNMDVIRANSGSLSAFIRGPKRQKSLGAFKAVQTSTGVSAFVKKGETMNIPSAFIAKTTKFAKNTDGRVYQGVFQRVGKGRYPLKSLYALSIGHLLKTDWVQNIINKIIGENAQRVFNHELEFYIGRWFSKRK
jgi:hypothetical protein